MSRPLQNRLLLCALSGACSLGILVSGCHRDVRISKQMTWQCEPSQDQKGYPDVQSVRFRFLESPSYSELVPGSHLCDSLRAQRKPIVTVDFTIFGDSWNGMRGYTIDAINGKPYVSRVGWGSSKVD